MRKRQGKVIEDAEGLSILAPRMPEPDFRGGGDINWVCGHCDHLLVECMLPGQIEDIVIKCFSCDAFNQITSDRERPGSTRPDSN
jgi:phage FluMu protein Com